MDLATHRLVDPNAPAVAAPAPAPYPYRSLAADPPLLVVDRYQVGVSRLRVGGEDFVSHA